MSIANFVIAGTEKAGTTSVFTYLSQHPEVTASRRKETDFFRRGGGRQDYERFFPDQAREPVVMEASPGYLGEAAAVVPRMREMIPDVRLLFILREPIDRLYSSFRFHRSRLNLPQSLTFHGYVEACMAYADRVVARRGDGAVRGDGEIDDWHLNVLRFGRYAMYLRPYFEAFPRYNIKVSFYDDLCRDPEGFMSQISGFLEIDEAFWGSLDLQPMNVTFFSRSRYLHRLAVLANDRLEPVLRPRPRLKSAVLGLYKHVNASSVPAEAISQEDRELLEWYYAPWNVELESLLEVALPASWSTGLPEAERFGRRVDPGAWLS